MKNESGLGVIQMIIIIFILIAVAVWGIFLFYNYKSNIREKSVLSDMLLIQGACKVSYETNVMNKTTDELVGTKLSEVDQNEEITKSIIDEFKKLNIVNEEDYDKYYVLTNEDLKKLKLEVTNHEGAYYIVGYENEDVIFSLGYEGKYRIAEINNEKIEEKPKEENKEDNEEDNEEESESSEENEKEDDETDE